MLNSITISHIWVFDQDEALEFYVDTLGLRAQMASRGALFCSFGDYHHHVGLNAWNGRSVPAGGHRGLAWWELVLPDEAARSAAVDRLEAAGHEVDGTSRVDDPDGMTLGLVVAD